MLSPENTKETHWKRVPIHKNLLRILENSLEICTQKVMSLSNKVFLFYGKMGARRLEIETFKNVWPDACDALELKEPWPRFHDFRHTWRTNARRSGMDPQIAESILGHQAKARSVSEIKSSFPKKPAISSPADCGDSIVTMSLRSFLFCFFLENGIRTCESRLSLRISYSGKMSSRFLTVFIDVRCQITPFQGFAKFHP